MCEKVVEVYPWQLKYVPDLFKTQELCTKTLEVDPWQLYHILDWYKTIKFVMMRCGEIHILYLACLIGL